MNRIAEIFGKQRVLLPVIHSIAEVQVMANAELALEHGADGLFLIDQGGMRWSDVVRVARRLAGEGVPFVGVNLLALSTREALSAIAEDPIRGLWMDDIGVRYDDVELTDRSAWALLSQRAASPWEGLVFGGVAFKYTRPVVPPEHFGTVARLAVESGIDVITTSGPATGEPPSVEKVRAMREVIGDHALAVASGIRPENVEAFLPFVDAFLVATGIEAEFGRFDEVRLSELANTIHGWSRGATS